MRRNRETVLVRRNVQVELVPAGTPVELEEGTWCEVTQALGSSFTLLVEGQLVRLRGSDADAIGKQDPTPVVDHGDGSRGIYANLAAEPTVITGDVVACGAVIGAVGDTAIGESGQQTHLHFAMTANGQSVDPLGYLPG